MAIFLLHVIQKIMNLSIPLIFVSLLLPYDDHIVQDLNGTSNENQKLILFVQDSIQQLLIATPTDK